MSQRTGHVLLLVGDAQLREFVLRVLRNRRTTICKTPAEARERLRVGRYALVVITNFGIGPFHAVEVIPADRDYPALFLTGYMDDWLSAFCRDREIPWRQAPVRLDDLRRELRIALEDLTL
jgi:hypothetical protein